MFLDTEAQFNQAVTALKKKKKRKRLLKYCVVNSGKCKMAVASLGQRCRDQCTSAKCTNGSVQCGTQLLFKPRRLLCNINALVVNSLLFWELPVGRAATEPLFLQVLCS